MIRAIREIHEEFEAKGIKHQTEQLGDAWFIRLGINGDNSSYDFLFIKLENDDDSDVALRVFDIAKFPESRIDKAYEILNKFNSEYRFVRFAINPEGAVGMEYDFPINLQPIGPAAFEMLIRSTDILDRCYPLLMQAIWA